jgi:subtilase family serine protease
VNGRQGVAAALCAPPTLLSAGAVAVAAPAPAHVPSTARYAIAVPLCAPSSGPGLRCLGLRRVPARAGAAGAQLVPARPAALPLGPAGGYTPADLATAYGVNADARAGATQTVAIIDGYDDPDVVTDLDTFDSHYGLATETAGTTIRVVNQRGGKTLPAADTSGWSAEESLDVDAVRALCHRCHILVVEADRPQDPDMATAVRTAARLGATEISNSYGEREAWAAYDAPRVSKAYHQPGIVVTVSSGDDGWYEFDDFNESDGPDWPAVLRDVVAVGGTTLSLGSTGHRVSETVWNDDGVLAEDEDEAGKPLGATGGGCSATLPAPRWQSHLPGYARTGCAGTRLVSDVAADGNYMSGFDVYDSYDCGDRCHLGPSGWTTDGGTSLSAPLVAAMWADAGGLRGLAPAALTLYGHARSRTGLYDVTSGGNDVCAADASCLATGGDA